MSDFAILAALQSILTSNASEQRSLEDEVARRVILADLTVSNTGVIDANTTVTIRTLTANTLTVNGSINGAVTFANTVNVGGAASLANTLSVTGLATFAASINVSGGTITGNGVNISSLNATALTTGTVPDARFPATLPAVSGVNLTNLNASALASGTVPDARFPATLPAISGVNLTNLDASDLASGTVPDARFPAALPAISGVNLTNLDASDLASGTVPTARLGSGTANSTTFLRGDQTWATLAFSAFLPADGRLTLTSGTPVTTSDVSAAGTLYYTPHVGNRLALYDGSQWTITTFTERSLALTLTSGTNYDVFIFDSAGTLTLETVAWTNNTTRATALVRQEGVLVKSGALTRRYLGTIRASGTNITEDSLTKRYVWNMYHRVDRPLRRLESTDSWTYGTAAFRQANGSTSNQLDIVVGISEDGISVDVLAHVTGVSNENAAIAIGEDSTTAAATGSHIAFNRDGVTFGKMTPHLVTIPAIGGHSYTWLEYASVNHTFYGDNGTPTLFQSGISAMWRA